ncbi:MULTISPECIES: LytR/AlgR family response regulator transcription factor [Tenacibaculum]|uniref:LytR/AlgR family response regulator transcription factor n=1 Tax=Tenacibaculum TaxID=104267 RepID=UPI000EB15252|nr:MULTISPECIES: LytTR family DNA-binding domain-containing protein [Tenacibaculum]NVK08169.1 response regulator transcription factor [Tenacibaculum sp.]RLK00419.1 LytTR family two component transcriptional regulator [Tenacibaculum discolor]
MNCIVIDDELMSRMILKKVSEQVEGLKLVGEFSNAIQAIKFLNNNKVDAIFLDIHMPDFTGFDLIQTLKDPPKIVLTTSDRNFAVEAFEYDFVVDYIVKPIELERFKKSVEKIIAAIEKDNNVKPVKKDQPTDVNTLYVNIDRRLVKIDIPSIYVVEAKGDYIKVKTEEKNYIVHSPLKKIEEKLPSESFLKVHRSYIINTNEIIDIEDNSVLIKQDVIPVSRSNRNELKRRLNLL